MTIFSASNAWHEPCLACTAYMPFAWLQHLICSSAQQYLHLRKLTSWKCCHPTCQDRVIVACLVTVMNESDLAYSRTLNTLGVLIFLCWLWSREFAEGNDLSTGLKKCFIFLYDLRRLVGSDIQIPQDYWGNAFSVEVVMPPPPPTGLQPQERSQSILAAAACAVHVSYQTLRADPAAVSKALGFYLGAADVGHWKQMLDAPGFNPFRDGAAGVSSWRSMSVERADFGQGMPWVVAGAPVATVLHLNGRVLKRDMYQKVYTCTCSLRSRLCICGWVLTARPPRPRVAEPYC